jgi:hypothetical protein
MVAEEMPRPSSKRWRWVAWSMAAGALYDLGFSAAILLFREPAADLLGLPLPRDPVYLGLVGVLLALLAGLYALAAISPERYQGVVLVAAVGRLAGFAYLGVAWLAGRPDAFLTLAIGDLVFALLHATLLVAARWHRGAQVHEIPGT